MKEAGDKIDGAVKGTVEADIADLKAVLERTKDQTDLSDSDIDALKSGKEKLMNDAQQLFAQMYQGAPIWAAQPAITRRHRAMRQMMMS